MSLVGSVSGRECLWSGVSLGALVGSVSGCTDHGLALEQEQVSKALPFVASLLALARALEEETREQLHSIVSRTRSFYHSILSSYDPAVLARPLVSLSLLLP